MVDFADEAIRACLTDTAKMVLGTKLVGGTLVREDSTVERLRLLRNSRFRDMEKASAAAIHKDRNCSMPPLSGEDTSFIAAHFGSHEVLREWEGTWAHWNTSRAVRSLRRAHRRTHPRAIPVGSGAKRLEGGKHSV